MSEREATGSKDRCQSAAAGDQLALQLLDGLPDAVVLFDAGGVVKAANEVARITLGDAVAPGTARHVALGASTPLSDLVSHACRARRARTASDVPWGEKRLQVWVVPLDGPTADCLLVLREAAAVGARRDLWQAEKMAALGRLAASVAHEVRNPLGAVDIQLQLLAKDAEEIGGPVSTRLTQRVDRARAEMRRLDGIVQNFLRFSRPPAVHLTPTDPGLLVQRMHDLVAPEARARGIELELRRPDELPFVKADENVLSQALLNVLINAFQAVGEGQDEPLVELNVAVEAVAPSVRIEVTDNGCGVAEDDLERVFEYYYTTKDTGSGLGLSIAQGILQQHGGNLHLTSRVGSGTTVALVLPTCSLRP